MHLIRISISVLSVYLASTAFVHAKDIPYNRNVHMKVGQVVVLKGVRAACDAKTAPSFGRLDKLPKPKLGVLLDGGKGTLFSKSCQRKVPGRAIKFKAKKSGKETIRIYRDRITIRVD